MVSTLVSLVGLYLRLTIAEKCSNACCWFVIFFFLQLFFSFSLKKSFPVSRGGVEGIELKLSKKTMVGRERHKQFIE